MIRIFSFFIFASLISLNSFAQPQTREELERQRQQLKKEIEETEKQLKKNQAQTRENLLQFNLINRKVNLQDKIIDNINRDLSILNNNMYSISKDIRKYDKLLDTLKQEYAKSMVYAYKNRSNYDFLNFIFSASNFNDAMKRISYLKSYRTYREMQGQNIVRTQTLRKKRMNDLSYAKTEKNEVLDVQSKEMTVLETQKKEKDRVLNELKKQGKQLNKQIAAKQKQMQKVNNAIAAAIRKAQEEARKEALAKAAAEKERLRKLADAEAKAKANNAKTNTDPAKTTPPKITTTKPAPEPVKRESVLLNDNNIALNNSFEKNRGSLPWPLDRGVVLMHYGANTLPSGTVMNVTSVTISSEVGTSVKAVFDGTVTAVQPVEDMTVVIIQHGRYFTTYSNLTGVTVQKGQQIKTGQTLGRVAVNFDGVGAIDFYISNETSNYDPEKWLRRR
jgi:septal ring factor EnvC (AmiA/AmiB activator)